MEAVATQPKKAGAFTFDVIDEQEAFTELAELRSGKGGRVSKYEPLAQEVAKLEPGQALATEVGKNEVGGLRGYLRRRFGEKYLVRSSRQEDGSYAAYVFVNSENGRSA